MLTRLEVTGFKNLHDFALDFGPYTCIAGRNGVGKSNIFDAIHFLSLLTENTINDAALKVRQVHDAGESTGEIADLLCAADGARSGRIELCAEMLVPRGVADGLGRRAESSSSFLRYEVALAYEGPSDASGPLGGLTLEREELRPIQARLAGRRLRFPHDKGRFRDSVVYNRRRGSPYIDTPGANGGGQEGREQSGTVILVHQDGGSRGPSRPVLARQALRTIIGTENTVATPTILAARQEMRSWRMLALEPSAMRRPDRYTQAAGIAANGAHIPATLYQSALAAAKHGDDADDVYGMVTSRLADLLSVKKVGILRDDVRRLLSLTIEDDAGLQLPASAISDGTLRFLALAVLAEVSDECAVFCMEEPENGIHPDGLPAMNELLEDIAVDPYAPVAGGNGGEEDNEAAENGADNPLRQVIVATHSPYFVQLQEEANLLLARKAEQEGSEGVLHRLECVPVEGSWRCSAAEGRPALDKLALQSYLEPPGSTLFQMTMDAR